MIQSDKQNVNHRKLLRYIQKGMRQQTYLFYSSDDELLSDSSEFPPFASGDNPGIN